MKNIRNILAKGVFMLLVSLLAMACTEKSDLLAKQPFDFAERTSLQSTWDAFEAVLQFARASYSRDINDKRIVEETDVYKRQKKGLCVTVSAKAERVRLCLQ